MNGLCAIELDTCTKEGALARLAGRPGAGICLRVLETLAVARLPENTGATHYLRVSVTRARALECSLWDSFD